MTLLSHRPFRLLFLSRAASVVGDQIAPIAVSFAVLDMHGSASDLGLVLGARTLTFVVFVLIGGVWADRVSRRRLMVASDLGRLLSQGALGVLVVTHASTIPLVVALQGANGAWTAFFRPAANGLTPLTVAPGELQRANSLLAMTDSSAQIVGPALAGVVIVAAGPGWGIVADAATFAISALLLTWIGVRETPPEATAASFITDLRDGWTEVRSRTWLWIMILVCAAFQVLVVATFMVLGPVLSNQALGGAAAWTTISLAMGLGALVGAAAGIRAHVRRPLVASNLSLALAIPPLVLLGARAPLAAIAVAALGLGFAISFFGILYETAIQERVPPAALSRVASYDWLGSTALRPLGYAAVGPLAAVIGADSTLFLAAALLTPLILGSAVTTAIRTVTTIPRPVLDPPSDESDPQRRPSSPPPRLINARLVRDSEGSQTEADTRS